jgi:signal transduction histidine kinase
MKDPADAPEGAFGRPAEPEVDLESLRKELDHAHQLATLGTLTAGIAHEINNILTPVLAYAQLASANPDDEALRSKALDKTIVGVETASRIIEAVLGFARSEDREGPANVADVIDSTIACLGRPPERDGITLIVKADPHAHVRIQPLALQQVLLNLVLNAVAVLRGNAGELRIDVARDGEGRTQIRVADDGPGISPEVAETLFEPFVTSRSKPKGHGRSGGTGGSGLGLAICQRLIEEAGGSIGVAPGWFTSATATGPGATFTITLPTFAKDGEQKAA